MKKFILCTLTSFLAFTFIPNEMKATNDLPKTQVPQHSAVANGSLVTRLDEINSMDKSTLSRNEKKELRKEVRTIDKQLRDNGVIYISTGALIIIIILLIILL